VTSPVDISAQPAIHVRPPFKARILNPSQPMHRFTKPGGHVAEIRERTVTQFAAIEFLIYVDGSFMESQMFHGGRAAEYPAAIASRIAQFIEGGWAEAPTDTPSH
jgi:hypothetical protein